MNEVKNPKKVPSEKVKAIVRKERTIATLLEILVLLPKLLKTKKEPTKK